LPVQDAALLVSQTHTTETVLALEAQITVVAVREMLACSAGDGMEGEIVAHAFVSEFPFATALKIPRILLVHESCRVGHVLASVGRETLADILTLEEEIPGTLVVVRPGQCLMHGAFPYHLTVSLPQCAQASVGVHLGECGINLSFGCRFVEQVVLLVAEIPASNAAADVFAVEAEHAVRAVGATVAERRSVITRAVNALIAELRFFQEEVIEG